MRRPTHHHAFLLLAVLLPGSAFGEVVYAYTGPDYQYPSGSYNSSMAINGSVTLSAAVTPSNGACYAPVACSSSTFVRLPQRTHRRERRLHIVHGPNVNSYNEDQGSNNCNADCNQNCGVALLPGTWSEVEVSDAPEPSAISLAALGMLLTAGIRWYRPNART